VSNREYSEIIITEKIMKYFYSIADNSEAFSGSGKNIKFNFFISGIKYTCQTEKALEYRLPNNYMVLHNADIIIIRNENNADQYVLNPSHKFVSIEIKHKSDVTDAFKSRSYDMMHLRKEHPVSRNYDVHQREKSHNRYRKRILLSISRIFWVYNSRSYRRKNQVII